MQFFPALLPGLITAVALAFYAGLILKIALFRGKHNLAPSTKGDEAFERLCRIQVNTSEQLILFIPALWLCAMFGSSNVAGLGGVIWLVGRALYMRGYAQSFEKRKVGFLLTLFSSILLVLAGVVALIQQMFML